MEVFGPMETNDYEQVVFCHDKVSGLKSIIAIHNSTLGPTLGGVRMWPYKSEEEALTDALRLSRGMTYKSAVMGLNVGGGKAVIIGDPARDKSEELLRAFGKFIDTLGGRYITAEDVGTTTEDMEIIRSATEHVVGLPWISGNPSPVTAFGVLRAMQACVLEVFGDESLAGRTVAIQGAGNVGYFLAEQLLDEGAKVYITDIVPEKVQRVVELGAEAISPDEVYDVECDVFAPCALGGVINDDTVGRLKAKIVCGSANNQLLEERHAAALAERNILYAPDFVANGGGVINVASELAPDGYDRDRALAKVSTIFDIMLSILQVSKEEGIGTNEAANRLAEDRIEKALRQKRIYVPTR
ncbi:MAG TPA: Glu/Leu/Phe/Val dehydrogenase dimerization domain-containing protein [Bacillota bacterium]|nr:Glu/Leu/Phe/Val dehydrogenase dimerization domain-containing protein [Bacillota bacterium]HPV12737.1 Glu/Leu/Phe/Val dehydrogenase dimerization domain-containing protein [Bacillota bacterium]HPZ78067.1 Glu/Leu/Phe/Val dehydrogenase dimerization domain-containing protein [Bacillota bacterium]HQD74305.1 Glu/Leu/Phe/Val dehydrogenase dimerization domain-containing protein [Bacillota bacterium]